MRQKHWRASNENKKPDGSNLPQNTPFSVKFLNINFDSNYTLLEMILDTILVLNLFVQKTYLLSKIFVKINPSTKDIYVAIFILGQVFASNIKLILVYTLIQEV